MLESEANWQPMDATQSDLTTSSGPRLKAALALAIIADIVQMGVFPLVIEGAASPADDLVDLCVGGALTFLLGWHWEFLPSFAGKLLPGVDLVPLWTLAVANVYRKSKALPAAHEGVENARPVGKGSTREC
jgi:hypothetical protein